MRFRGCSLMTRVFCPPDVSPTNGVQLQRGGRSQAGRAIRHRGVQQSVLRPLRGCHLPASGRSGAAGVVVPVTSAIPNDVVGFLSQTNSRALHRTFLRKLLRTRASLPTAPHGKSICPLSVPRSETRATKVAVVFLRFCRTGRHCDCNICH